ncbi:hypothetical protein [Halomicrobium zhouii]|uniref:hypothetical protein n=1 Tax=Halomicrobium zhouii TaxID=767519 RepID=UPI001160C2F6|nr:hypothetical protein [Halomicrobium zhouii]
MDDQSPPSRRSVLAVGAAAATTGCIGPLSNGPTCTLSFGEEIEHDALYRIYVGHTSNNASNEGSCDRWTAKRCFEAELWVDTDVIDRIEAKAVDGDVVAAWDADTSSTAGSSSASETELTTRATDDVFEGVTETASTEDADFGPDVPDSAYSVYLELGSLGSGDSATREIVIYSDGSVLGSSRFSLDC